MKKYILFLLVLIPINVFAAGDRIETSLAVSDHYDTATGSQYPEMTPSYTVNSYTLITAYNNLHGTYREGDRVRVDSTFCVTNNNFRNYYLNHSSSSMDVIDYSVEKSDEPCVKTYWDGSTYVGQTLITHVTFEYGSATTGFSYLVILYDQAVSRNAAYKTYDILTMSDIKGEQNTQQVIDNNNQNTQEVITNNNENTDKINDTIHDNLNTCNPNLFDKNNANVLNAYFWDDTARIVSNNYYRTMYVKVKQNTNYYITKSNANRYFRIASAPVLPAIGNRITDRKNFNNQSEATFKTWINDNYLLITYYYTGYENVSETDILNSITIQEGTSKEDVCKNKLDSINDSLGGINSSINETNDKLDDMKNMDISDDDKQMPDDSDYQDYQNSENELLDKVGEADLSNFNVAMDVHSSSWVWNTLTSLIQANGVIFSMFISILSIGVIKLALGR